MPTPDQIRAARAILGMSQPEVADAAGISSMTVKRAEGSGRPPASPEALTAIQRVFEAAGVIFVDANGDGPGVRMRKYKRGDIVRARQAGRISGIRVEKHQTGIVTVVELVTEPLGQRYRLTVQFDDCVPLPLAAADVELVRPSNDE